MGNRTFLYTTDSLPESDDDDPEYAASVAEANNSLPMLWAVMLADPRLGSAQDYQQVFLPSVYGGIYAERAGADKRLFRVLDFLTRHPGLPDRARFAQQVVGLRDFLASLPGEAYSADLNEWFWLDSDQLSPEQHLDRFSRQCVTLWEQLEDAMSRDDFKRVARLLEMSPRDPVGTLGFACWSHAYFYGDKDGGPSRLTFDDFRALPEPDYSQCDDYEDHEIGAGLMTFREGKRIGLRRADGTVVLPAQFDDVNVFYPDDVFAFVQQDGMLGTIDREGQVLIAPCISEVLDVTDNIRLVKADGFGFLNAQGRWLTPARYQSARRFVNGMAQVTRDDRHGYVAMDGSELLGDWRSTGDFNAAGIGCVKTDDGWTLIDRQGTSLFTPQFRKLIFDDVLDAWIGTREVRSMSVLTASGAPWFSGEYDEVTCKDAGGAAIVGLRGKCGVIPRGSAMPSVPLRYPEIHAVYPSVYTAVDDEDMVSLFSADGRLLIAERFEDMDAVECVPEDEPGTNPDDLVAVQLEGRIGVWSLSAQRLVTPCAFESVCLVRGGTQAWLVLKAVGGGICIANTDGKLLNEHRYEWIGANYYGELESDWHYGLLHAELERQWLRNMSINARRDGAVLHLYADGREETELDVLLRQAASAPPIVALEPLVQQLPLPARAQRPVSHTIAGVGDPDACYRISEIYQDGLGVYADPGLGFRWLATAAAGGQPDALYEYGYCLMEGEGCDPDPEHALRMFDRRGPESRGALNCMGYIYENKLRRRDLAKARALYMQAAVDGEYGLAMAQFNAGRCWRFGIGGPVNIDTALQYFEWAAYKGDPPSRASQRGAALAAGELYLDKALAEHKAGQAEQSAGFRKRGSSLLKQAVLEGDEEACLLLARTLLGEFGGDKNAKACRLYLDRALRNPELRQDAEEISKRHGI